MNSKSQMCISIQIMFGMESLENDQASVEELAKEKIIGAPEMNM